MDQENRIYVSKVISIQHYHGNIMHSNHGNGTQQDKDFTVFKKHRANDRLLRSMVKVKSSVTKQCYALMRYNIYIMSYALIIS